MRTVSPRLSRWPGAAVSLLGRPVRAVLLVFFACCGALALAHANPTDTGSADRFRLDLADHAVRSAELVSLKHEPADGAWSRAEIVWSTGPLRWWSYKGRISTSDLRPLVSEFDRDHRRSLELLAADRPGLAIKVGDGGFDGGGSIGFRNDSWLRHLPGLWLPRIAGAAYVGVLLLMLFRGRDRHRHGSRWSWFWIFAGVPVAVFLYLALEIRPLWRPATEPVARSGFHLSGLRAFLLSIVLGLACTAALEVLAGWVF
ncbi:hypothetical protein [Actinocorallia longicatena]|uniref:Uncharacterized protein n=1 Tax=Actinocorallia longicatena TaxID=111803 RepID=A0ABP6QGN9_9ACTN